MVSSDFHARRTNRVPREHGALLLVVLAALVAGCSTPIGVERIGSAQLFQELTESAVEGRKLSVHTTEVVGRYNLLELFESDPDAAIADLHGRAFEEGTDEHLLALAELSLVHARETEDRTHSLAAVVYAYLFLFHPDSQEATDPFDPRFRVACDVYNASLTEFLRSDDGDAQIESGTVALPFGHVKVEATRPGFPWGPEVFPRFVPAYDFEIRGLRLRNRSLGLGAPLIAIQARLAKPFTRESDARAPAAKTSATAFLRISGDRDQLWAGELAGTLELYATQRVQDISVEGKTVPLEADFTAPLAYSLEGSRIWKQELAGFLSGADTPMEPGLYFVAPYDPTKIPVVFVHGTASSPARWAEMFNGLSARREIRDRYQFWFFLYTTGNPILYSAWKLRTSLEEAVATLDPDGTNRALRRMVVIGHSQGGLLTRLIASDSGSTFWDLWEMRTQGHELNVEAEARLREVLVYDDLPFVERVIFISTPHRGSYVAGNWIGKLGASLISIPSSVGDFVASAFEEGDPLRDELKNVSTSVDQMDPESSFIQMISGMPVDPRVKKHSIIPVEGDGPIEEGNDGVVEYSSAHIEPVDSEFVVRWGHSCQSRPLVILEVRRILREHLDLRVSTAPPE